MKTMKKKLLILSFMSLFLSSIFAWGERETTWEEAQNIGKEVTFDKDTEQALNNALILLRYADVWAYQNLENEAQFEVVVDKALTTRQDAINVEYAIRNAIKPFRYMQMQKAINSTKYVSEMLKREDPEAALKDIDERYQKLKDYQNKYKSILDYS